MATQDYGLTPDLEAEQEALLRRRKIGEALLTSSRQPVQGRMVGRTYVRASPLEGLAAMFEAAQGRKEVDAVDTGLKDIRNRYTEGLAAEVERISRLRSGTPTQVEPAEYGEVVTNRGEAPNPRAAIEQAMLSRYPQVQRMGELQHRTYEAEQTRAADRESRAAIAQDGREARMAELEARLADARTRADERAALQRELAQMRIDAQRELRTLAGSMRQPAAPVAVMGPDGKPVYVSPDQAVGRQPAGKSAAQLPGSALKLQQEELDAINTAASISADVGALKSQIDSGQLAIGTVRNATSQAKNFLGLSDENSRNFASFRATLEKLRNDSLRLNKGVQTEGDAQRAWNELVSSINDPKVVSQRLDEIQKINERAIDLRRNNINVIRSNYGVDPLEDTPKPAAAVGRGGSGGWEVVR